MGHMSKNSPSQQTCNPNINEGVQIGRVGTLQVQKVGMMEEINLGRQQGSKHGAKVMDMHAYGRYTWHFFFGGGEAYMVAWAQRCGWPRY
jgi:hypothetical protein